MHLVNYIDQIILIKTTIDDLLMVKVIGKDSIRYKGYKVKILEKNGQNMDLETIIYDEEIKKICILPNEVQQGIELTLNHLPIEIFKNTDLPSLVEFGKSQKVKQ
ncbi:hypothetical protein [Sutcliffiella cohnii]|uniref:Uncharacterized protein n=1 Tax=Sutcliffiella cohnii TaxID=33932 RepID=A0A223KR19_9BACI|nr:hypothetical protein [Sutcliffiella cohnii]AST91919.1 hypothetical protein BC6307_11855 [Sutcliffiella cohnii]MED4015194.1 hypothetical protein [Sutcliffiella cohnii]